VSLQLADGGPNMIPTPFLDAHNQLDKRKALNVIVLSMTVRTVLVCMSHTAVYRGDSVCVQPGTFM